MTKIVLTIVVVSLVACDPGPLPPVGKPAVGRADRFPSTSEEPWPLSEAIRTGRLDEVRTLLNTGANPNERWGQRGDYLPVQEALSTHGYTISDRIELVRLLLDHGADPNARWCPFESRGDWEWGPGCTSAHGTTPLILAAMFDSIELVELLLSAGADATMRDYYHASPLDYAYDEVVFETISRSLFPNLQTRNQEALAWLNQYGGRFYGANPWESTPLSRALSQSDGGFVPPPPPPVGATEASYRAERESRLLKRVRTLLRVGADPNERATRAGADWTPLSMAVDQGAFRAMRLLLQNGADPSQRWCAPIFFARYGATFSHRPPSRSKAPGCTFDNGMTPLMQAASMQYREPIEVLLEFKADRSLRDWAGRSALDYAQKPGVRELLSERR